MAKHREVVDRDDERHPRTEWSAHGWAMEDVEAVASSGQGQRGQVPRGVTDDPGRAARAAEGIAAQLERTFGRQGGEEAGDVASGAGPGQGERRDVDPDSELGHGTSRSVSEPSRVAREVRLAARVPREPGGVDKPVGDETISLDERALDGVGEGLRAARIGPDRRVACRLVEEACEDATTGTPLAIASTTGIPKPSKSEG